MINFDIRPDRRNTCCSKWDHPRVKNTGALPMWVADMDFCSPPEVVQALVDRAAHGAYGYTHMPDDFRAVITAWCRRRYGLEAAEEEIITSPGVLYTLRAVIDVWTKPGEQVLIQTPAYPPFFSIPRDMGRELVCNAMQWGPNGFDVDWADLEEKFAAGVKMMILCNPHNPTGRVWQKDDLTRLAGLCKKYGVKVVADEIHCDLIMPGYQFTSFQNFLEENLPVVSMFSCTKTFNLAGLNISSALVRNAELREAIKQRLYAFAPQDINIFAMVAQYTAYTRGEYWLDELREYINGNLDVVQQIFARDPRFKLVKSQGTYLQFVDCTALGMDEAALENFLVEKCGVYPSMGGSFGAPGCIRINVAMPRADVTAAIERIVEAAAEIQ